GQRPRALRQCPLHYTDQRGGVGTGVVNHVRIAVSPLASPVSTRPVALLVVRPEDRRHEDERPDAERDRRPVPRELPTADRLPAPDAVHDHGGAEPGPPLLEPRTAFLLAPL